MTHQDVAWETLTDDQWNGLPWEWSYRLADGGSDIHSQRHTLEAWAEDHYQPVRNVRFERRLRVNPDAGWDEVAVRGGTGVTHWKAAEQASPPVSPEPETFPAAREDDCRYGCCKAGDTGICSDGRGVAEREAFSLATSEAAEKFDERDQEMSWIWLCAKLFFACPVSEGVSATAEPTEIHRLRDALRAASTQLDLAGRRLLYLPYASDAHRAAVNARAALSASPPQEDA